jgi:hypothetical protein
MINTTQLYLETIHRARGGSITAARRLLSELARYVEADKPIPKPLKEYALEAFRAGTRKNGSLDKGFHLSRARGRSPVTLRHKQMVIANEVYKLRKRGFKAQDAYDQVAESFHKDADTVKRIYLENKGHIMELEKAGSLAGWMSESQYL